MPDPILNLDTLIVRPTVEIDGERYEILSSDELSVLDSRRFTLWCARFQELQQGEQEGPELDELVDTIARKVLVGVPAEVLDRLTGVHKMAVVEVFTGLLLRSRMSTAGAVQTAIGNRLIGELLSPSFSASTEAPRKIGWWARLSRWFGRLPT